MLWPTERLSDALEEVVGLAVVDPDFATELLDDPVAAVRDRRLALTAAEIQLLSEQRALDLPGLARNLLQGWREISGATPLVPAYALARIGRNAASPRLRLAARGA